MADLGYFCIVTAHNAVSEGVAQSNDLLSVYKPNNTVQPNASGSNILGNLLSVTDGTWLHSPSSFSYQWKRAPTTAIPSATAATYTTVPADLSHSIFCTVTAANAAGTMAANSNFLGPIGVTPSIIDDPVITGTIGVEIGSLLTCTNGNWQAMPEPVFTYQWKITPMTDIPGATDPSFVLTTTQLGQSVYCTVTATNDFGTASEDSNTVGPVTNPATALTVWDSATKTDGLILSGGNLIVTNSGSGTSTFGQQQVRGTTSHNTGKKYFEITLTAFGDPLVPDINVWVGLVDSTYVVDAANYAGGADELGALFTNSGINCTGVAMASSVSWYPNPTSVPWAEGMVVGIAVDMDARKMFFAIDGVFVESVVHGNDPEGGIGGLSWGATMVDDVFPLIMMQWQAVLTGVVTTNFGSDPFTLAPLPTGYTAWG